jgi:hypothetical protein
MILSVGFCRFPASGSAAVLLGCSLLIDASAQAQISLTLRPTASAVAVLEFRAQGAIAWADDSSVAVIDGDEQQVNILTLSTGSSRVLGRNGDGPGEFRGAISVLANAHGELLVADMRLRRVSHFDEEQGFVRSQPLPGLPLALVGWAEDSLVAAWMELGRSPRAVVGELNLVTGDVREVLSLFDPDSGLSPPGNPNPFSPPLLSVAQRRDGSLLAGEGRAATYRIVEFDTSGTLKHVFGRPELEPEFPTSEQIAAARELNRRVTANQPARPPPEFRQMMEESLRQPNPFFGPDAFAVDAEDRLWIATARNVGGRTALDVFNPSGELIETVEVRDRVMGFVFRGSRVAMVVERLAEDVRGFHGVDVYEIGRREK